MYFGGKNDKLNYPLLIAYQCVEKMNRNIDSYEGIVVNSLIENSNNSTNECRYQDIFNIGTCKVPVEERKVESLSIKELYAHMNV